MLKVKCECGRTLKVPEKLVGRNINCPACGATILAKDDVSDWIGKPSPMLTQEKNKPLTGLAPDWYETTRKPNGDKPLQNPPPLPPLETPIFKEYGKQLDLTCPRCGSDNTQKVSVICEAGTPISDAKAKGGGAIIGTDLDGHLSIAPVIHSANTKTVSRTTLASRLSPPDKPSSLAEKFNIALVIITVAAFLILMIVNSNSQESQISYFFGR
jgi:DNA-directed RNA polymerase subunit RPC12/RpoP